MSDEIRDQINEIIEADIQLKINDYIEKWLLEFCEKTDWIKDEFYFIAHWRRYAIYKKEVYGDDGEFEWCLEDMGASSPDRYFYKDGKIEEGWSTPMEDDE